MYGHQNLLYLLNTRNGDDLVPGHFYHRSGVGEGDEEKDVQRICGGSRKARSRKPIGDRSLNSAGRSESVRLRLSGSARVLGLLTHSQRTRYAYASSLVIGFTTRSVNAANNF